jgi:poly(U)-specific endoribonuclease
MTDIYQKIWNSDKNGFSVSLRSGDSWKNPSADILLDIQVEASGKRSIDLATNPLFNRVNEKKFKLPTYVSFINLLDNYIANFRAEDILSEDEQKEIEIFLDKIVETEPVQIAYSYITEKLGVTLSKAEFRKSLRRIWFEMYTTHFKGKSTYFCSGFEHVFVGEAKFDANLELPGIEPKILEKSPAIIHGLSSTWMRKYAMSTFSASNLTCEATKFPTILM